jgi:alpha-tubulin suppressor-like RCC1 family protein
VTRTIAWCCALGAALLAGDSAAANACLPLPGAKTDPVETGDRVYVALCDDARRAELERDFRFSQWEDDDDNWGLRLGCSVGTPYGRTINALLLLQRDVRPWYDFARARTDELNPRCYKDDDETKVDTWATTFDGLFQDDRIELYMPFYWADVLGRAFTLVHESRHFDANDPSHFVCPSGPPDGSSRTDRYYLPFGIDAQTGAYSINTRVAASYAYGAQQAPLALRERARAIANNLASTRFCSYPFGQPNFAELPALGNQPPPARLAAGGSFTLFAGAGGALMAVGTDAYGQLGNGLPLTSAATAVAVSGVTAPVDVSANTEHACVVDRAGAVSCWGRNAFSRLGSTTTAGTAAAPSLPFASQVTRLSAGGSHTCALQSDTTAACWGRNDVGQLGGGQPGTVSATPVVVGGLVNASQLAAGGSHACALRYDGEVWCWGADQYGQLGRGSIGVADGITARRVPTIDSAIMVAAGFGHSCALFEGGALRCWGWNGYGQLGLGASPNRATPGLVAGLGPARTLSAGQQFTCAALQDGTAWCWGDNARGQLGDGSLTSRNTPVQVVGLRDVVAVAAGATHACALTARNAVWCWGDNASGQLGDGTQVDRPRPVLTRPPDAPTP